VRRAARQFNAYDSPFSNDIEKAAWSWKGMDMGTDMVGMFAISKAGHDKGTIYLIVKEEAQWVYLLDGRLKSAEKPKKKNKKHIQIIKKQADDTLREKLLGGKCIYNEEIRKAIEKL
jgi:ribosomal protein L14E/L6E/L27E